MVRTGPQGYGAESACQNGRNLRAAKNPRARASCRFAAFIWRLRHFAPALCRFSKPSVPFCCSFGAFRIPSGCGTPLRSAPLRFVPSLRPMACSTHLRLAKRHRGLCETSQGGIPPKQRSQHQTPHQAIQTHLIGTKSSMTAT